MLQHTKWLLDEKEEDGSSLIAIDKGRFHKLVTSLSTAIANEYKLDKEQTSFNDILDAFRLSLRSIRGPNKIMSKDFVAISINDSSTFYPPNSKLFCNLCNCNLILLDPQKEEWFCSRCNVIYYRNKGEKVKQTNKFFTP